jgi:hypothetical protein
VSSSVQRPRAGGYRSGVSRKSIVGTLASMQESKAVGVACLKSMNWVRVTGLFESYWRLRAWSCDLIGHLASAWSPRWNHTGPVQPSQGALWKALYVQDACTPTTGESKAYVTKQRHKTECCISSLYYSMQCQMLAYSFIPWCTVRMLVRVGLRADA